MAELNIYTGELKEGMPCRHMVRSYEGMDVGYKYYAYGDAEYPNAPDEIYHDNEWQRYKPQLKKVWGTAKHAQDYFSIVLCNGKASVLPVCNTSGEDTAPVWLSKEHAEQHAKALNMANEFRLLSDVPVEGESQWFVNFSGNVGCDKRQSFKLVAAIFGVVFNTREQAEQALAKLPQIHIANKIIQFGFHGIVEERL